MTTLQSTAEKTLQIAYKDSKPQIAIEVLTIISIIIGVIGVIQRCYAEKDVQKLAEKQTLTNRWMVKRVIKKHLTKEQYLSEGEKLLQSLFTMGQLSTPQDIQDLVKEININAKL